MLSPNGYVLHQDHHDLVIFVLNKDIEEHSVSLSTSEALWVAPSEVLSVRFSGVQRFPGG